MKKKEWKIPVIIKLNCHINSGGSGTFYPEYLGFVCPNGNVSITADQYLSFPSYASVIEAGAGPGTVIDDCENFPDCCS